MRIRNIFLLLILLINQSYICMGMLKKSTYVLGTVMSLLGGTNESNITFDNYGITKQWECVFHDIPRGAFFGANTGENGCYNFTEVNINGYALGQIGSVNSTELLENACVSSCTNQNKNNLIVIGQNISNFEKLNYTSSDSVSLLDSNLINQAELFPIFFNGMNYFAFHNSSCTKDLYLWQMITEIEPLGININNDLIMYGNNYTSTPFFPKSLNESFLYTNNNLNTCEIYYSDYVFLSNENSFANNFEVCINNELMSFSFDALARGFNIVEAYEYKAIKSGFDALAFNNTNKTINCNFEFFSLVPASNLPSNGQFEYTNINQQQGNLMGSSLSNILINGYQQTPLDTFIKNYNLNKNKTFTIANLNAVQLNEQNSDTLVNNHTLFSNISAIHNNQNFITQYKMPFFFNAQPMLIENNSIIFKNNFIKNYFNISNNKMKKFYDNIFLEFNTRAILGCFHIGQYKSTIENENDIINFLCKKITTNGLVIDNYNEFTIVKNFEILSSNNTNTSANFTSNRQNMKQVLESGFTNLTKLSNVENEGYLYWNLDLNNIEFLSSYNASLKSQIFQMPHFEDIIWNCDLKSHFYTVNTTYVGNNKTVEYKITLPEEYLCEASTIKGNNSLIIKWNSVLLNKKTNLAESLQVTQQNFLKCLPTNQSTTNFCDSGSNACLLITPFDEEICCSINYSLNENISQNYLNNINEYVKNYEEVEVKNISTPSYNITVNVSNVISWKNTQPSATCTYAKDNQFSVDSNNMLVKNISNETLVYINVPSYVMPIKLNNTEYFLYRNERKSFAVNIRDLSLLGLSLIISISLI